MTIAPEFETMVDVARKAYSGKQLESVEAFLGTDEETVPKNFKRAPKQFLLKNPFDRELNIGVQEAKNEQ